MSKNERMDMKQALKRLDVATPFRIAPQIDFTPPVEMKALDAQSLGDESIQGQSRSKVDSVNPELSPNFTVSKMDTVQIEQSTKRTVSTSDSAQNGVRPKRTVSKLDPVGAAAKPASSKGFTAVPNDFLRVENVFAEPIDMMIYLHFFTFSFGFGRDTASMSQSQLERFTRCGRNTVKRAVQRLEEAGWIKVIEEFEHARISRKWKVRPPAGFEPLPTQPRGSKLDTVESAQSPIQTQSGSNSDPVTVSKMDPFLERIPKEKSNNSLSPTNQVLREYFESLRPAAKRESERGSFRTLCMDYSEQQIADCLVHLQKHGVGGLGSKFEPSHSPMAYLGHAMHQVIPTLQSDRRSEQEYRERELARATLAQRRIEQEASESLEWARKERAFNRAFSSEEKQREVIVEGCRFSPFRSTTEAGRSYSIGKWWDGLSTYDKAEAKKWG